MNLAISPIKSVVNQKVSFRGYNVIDGHTHLGQHKDKNYRTEDLLSLTKAYNPYDWKSDDVSHFVVSSIEALSKTNDKYLLNETDSNKKILSDINNSNYPDKFIPLAVCQVDSGNANNIENLFRTEKNKFHGLKFHPMAIGIDADDKKYEPYMEVAKKHNVPCVFHTENGYAAPDKIYNLAKKFPTVPVVLYHMNIVPAGKVGDRPKEEIESKNLENDKDKWCWDVREKWNREGIDVVEQSLRNKDANLYLETSWAKPEAVIEAIKRVGPDRVIWGTDAPIGDYGENSNRERYIDNINVLKNAIRNEFGKDAEKIENKVFYENAEKLFKKQQKQNNILGFIQNKILNINSNKNMPEANNNKTTQLNLLV